MNELKERFPAQQVPAARLRAIAARAREQHAKQKSAGAVQERAPIARMPAVVFADRWMTRWNIGVLDIAAAAAVLCILASAAMVYVRGRNAEAARAKDTTEKNIAIKREKSRDVEVKDEARSRFTQADDGANDPMDALQPKPDPVDPANPGGPDAAKLGIAPVRAEPETEPAQLTDLDVPADMRERQPAHAQLSGDMSGSSGAFQLMNGAIQAIPYPLSRGARRLALKRYGGSKATEEAVELSLQWLAFHQEADGHWDSVKFGAGNKVDTAITALATEAFLEAGNTERVGKWNENVRRAVAWLISKQQSSGLVFDQTDAGAHRAIGYPTAMASLALAVAARTAGNANTIAAAQRAIDYDTRDHQQGEGENKLGWRYQPKSAGDISVSGWFIAAIREAKLARLNVDHASFDGAIKFLDSVQDGPRYLYMPGKEPNKRRCAIGNYCRQILGWNLAELQGSVDLFIQDGGVPNWGENGECADLYYWHFGTLCAFQQGGETWKRWNAAMKKTLTENQCKQGDDAGSWPVVGEFSGEWGRVGQTAFACQCLEVYYHGIEQRTYAYAQAGVPPLATIPIQPAAAQPAKLSEEKFARNMQVKISCNFVDTPLPKVVEFLNNVSEVKVELTPQAAAKAPSITLRVTDMELDLAMQWIATLGDVARRVDGGRVVLDVKPPERALPEKKNPEAAPVKPAKDEF